MQNLFEQIGLLDFGITGPALTEEAVARIQNALSDCGFPEIPEEVLEFLRRHNGFLSEGRCIFGIDDDKHFIYDILGENLIAENPSPADTLLLGATSGTYIAWDAGLKRYSMIDKPTFMVLHNFTSFTEAVKYILKIND